MNEKFFFGMVIGSIVGIVILKFIEYIIYTKHKLDMCCKEVLEKKK